MRTPSRYRRALFAITPLLVVGPAACLGPAGALEDEATDVASSAVVEPTCVTIQRGVAGDVFDAFLSGDHPTWAAGSSSDVWMGGSSAGNENRALFGFDLSPIPAGSVVTEASFHYRMSWNNSNGQIAVHRVLVPWSEATATSASFDVVNGIAPSPEMTFPGILFGWQSLDFTSLVSGWVSGAAPNHGVLMQEDPAYRHLIYGSEASMASRPYLTVCYDPPAPACGNGAPAVDADRSFIMSKQIPGSTASYPLGIDDLGGDTVAAGVFAGATVIGGVPVATTGPSDQDFFVARIDDNGHAVWVKRFGDATSQGGSELSDPRDGRHGVAVAPDGRVIVAGGFRGTVDFGGGPLVSPNGANDVFVVALDASGNHLWSKSFGGAGGDGRARSVAVGADGRVLVGGGFTGTIDFGGGALSQPGVSGDEDGLFLLELDASGNHLWSKRVGSATAQTRANDVGFDAAGNVLVTGLFGGTVDVGDGPLVASGARDVLVAKLDPSGTALWSRRFGDASDNNGDRGAGIAATPAGDVYVAGTIDGVVDFGGGAVGGADWTSGFLLELDEAGTHLDSKAFGVGSTVFGTDVRVDGLGRAYFLGWGGGNGLDFGGGPLSAGGSLHALVAGYCPSGGHLWSHAYKADSGNVFAQGLGVDGEGNILYTGWFTGMLDLGGHSHTRGQNDGVIIAKLAPVNEVDSDGDGILGGDDVCPSVPDPQQLDRDTDGEGDACDSTPTNGFGDLLWSRYVGGAGFLTVKGIALDPAGATVLGGSATSNASVGGPTLTGPVFVAKLDAGGDHVWSKSWGVTSPGNQVNAVAVGANGRVLFAGQAAGDLNLGGGLLPSGGGQDAFVGALDASGNHLWSSRSGDGQAQSASSIAEDAQGNVWVAGTFAGNIEFPGTRPLTSAGQSDLFLVRLNPFGGAQMAYSYGDAAAQTAPVVRLNAAGNIVLVGKLTGTIHFGAGISLTATGPNDVYVVELALGGYALSGAVISGPAGAAVSSFAADVNGNVLVAGTFDRFMTVGGAVLTSDEGFGGFVSRYSPSGAHIYSRAFTTDWPLTIAVSVDGAGNAVVGGSYRATLETDTLMVETPGPGEDAFVMRLDTGGGALYFRRYGVGNAGDGFHTVASDAAGNAVFAGFGAGALDFGAGPTPGVGNVTLLKLDP